MRASWKAGLIVALLASGVAAQTPPAPPAHPSPNEIIEAAQPTEWRAIAASDLLVMTLAPDATGRERRVIIQLMPAPFSEGWVENIRTLARAHWWDGLAVVRVQDNYVTQWGDPDGEDPARARALPTGLRVMGEGNYGTPVQCGYHLCPPLPPLGRPENRQDTIYGQAGFREGWPFATTEQTLYPVHCYGMVGVGRNLSPDTGTGAELYTVIGHAPRHLDANIALVGRVIEGMPHLSSLPRGTGPLGFYETPAERTGIVSIRLASELPTAEQPRFEYLSTEAESFALYADARANRRDPFFIRPAGGADICNIPVPVRRERG